MGQVWGKGTFYQRDRARGNGDNDYIPRSKQEFIWIAPIFVYIPNELIDEQLCILSIYFKYLIDFVHFWPVINKKYADIYIPWPLILNMVILPIVFVFILPQLAFGLKICDHGTKTDEKCPIYLEKETSCNCKEVTKPKKQYQMKYFHQHEKENSNWLKISCKGISPIQMLRNDSSYQNKTEMNTNL